MEIYRKIYPNNENGWDEGICSHATYTILNDRLYEKFHNFEYFIFYNYEFNLIIQVVYTHFRHNWYQYKDKGKNLNLKSFEFSKKDRLKAERNI